MEQLCKITLGIWDHETIMAAKIVTQRQRLMRPHLDDEDPPLFYQELMASSGRHISILWMFVPFGAILTKLGEAANMSPVFVTEEPVHTSDILVLAEGEDDDEHNDGQEEEDEPATDFLLECPMPSQEQGGSVTPVMDEGGQIRIATWLLYLILFYIQLLVCLNPSAGAIAFYMLVSIGLELKTLILDDELVKRARMRKEIRKSEIYQEHAAGYRRKRTELKMYRQEIKKVKESLEALKEKGIQVREPGAPPSKPPPHDPHAFIPQKSLIDAFANDK